MPAAGASKQEYISSTGKGYNDVAEGACND